MNERRSTETEGQRMALERMLLDLDTLVDDARLLAAHALDIPEDARLYRRETDMHDLPITGADTAKQSGTYISSIPPDPGTV